MTTIGERMSHAAMYLSEATEILRKLDADVLERMAALIVETRGRGGRLFVVGVGGGAGHASHAVADFRKIGGIEAYAPSDNVSELTARINDEGWDTAYAAWLAASRLGPGDLVLVFSVGGGDPDRKISVNLVRALDYARSTGARIIGVVGRDGGYTARVAEACLVVPTVNPANVTAHTESLQALAWHLLVSHPDVQTAPMKWESVERRGSGTPTR
jgi:D-sedoheptulose 7-phosphate isomerase